MHKFISPTDLHNLHVFLPYNTDESSSSFACHSSLHFLVPASPSLYCLPKKGCCVILFFLLSLCFINFCFFCFWSLFQWYCFLKFDLSRPPYNNHWVESSSCFRNHYVVTIQKTVRFYFRLLNVIVISSYTPCYIIRTFVVLSFLIPGRSTDNSWTQYQPILPSASS